MLYADYGNFQSNVEDRLPAVLKLEEESRSLREFHVLDIEVPGQYFNDQVIFSFFSGHEMYFKQVLSLV